MNCFEELKERGFCYQATDEAKISQMLNEGKATFYVGFDPTGNSLHVGHLLPVMAMRILQKAGHTPIVLVGGATARIGDPSGKSTARPMLSIEEIDANAASLRNQLSRFIDGSEGKAHFVNNAEWLCQLGYIDLLREVGSIFSVNRMLSQESVKMRLETGLSFLEFNYSILQAYDFLTLRRKFGCTLEMGGQDQWGNMVAGTELIRRKDGAEVHCMTIPLLLDPNGQKFGKSTGNKNVWLDKERTSVFDYYQFWRNCDDSMVEQLLKYFTPLPVAEIADLCAPGSNINRAKEILAAEATALCHGEEAAKEAFVTAGTRFGFADPENKIPTTSFIGKVTASSVTADLPEAAIPAAEVDAEKGILVARLLVLAGLCKSNSDGRRLIQGGAVALNDEKITDPNAALTADIIAATPVLRAGKKNMRRLKLA
ncbi:MAG: tyrosine--tRNA ligase [Lentisphaerae bacterium]|nr:tyrosine--tRNA ligase [Lentisphaerota bacterium]